MKLKLYYSRHKLKPIQEYKTLAILFAPGLGGNHLANMISTSPLVENRTKNTLDYEQYLIDLYKNSDGSNFHVEGFLNFACEDYTKAYNLVAENELTTVLPGHMEDGYWVLNKIKPLGPIGFITIEVFDIDIFNFYKTVPQRSYVDQYNPWLYRFMYNKETAARLIDVPKSDGYVIDAGKIIQPDISELLDQLNNELQLNMNLELCKELHSLRHKKAY